MENSESLVYCIRNSRKTTLKEWKNAFEDAHKRSIKAIAGELIELHKGWDQFKYLSNIRFQDVLLDYLKTTKGNKNRTALDFLAVMTALNKREVEKLIWQLKELNDFYCSFNSHAEGEAAGTEKHVVLLSTSERRRNIMKSLLVEQEDVVFTSADNDVKIEYFSEVSSPYAGVTILALQKLLNILLRKPLRGLVIAADTVILYEDAVLGKAHTTSEALARLNGYSGKLIRCITGIAAADFETGEITLDFNVGDIIFRDFSELLTPKEENNLRGKKKGKKQVKKNDVDKRHRTVKDLMTEYVNDGKNESKAGSFGIQDIEIITAAHYVIGDWLTVIGFPHPELCALLGNYVGERIKPLESRHFWPPNVGGYVTDKLIPANKFDMLIQRGMEKEYREKIMGEISPNPLIYYKYAQKAKNLNIFQNSSGLIDYYNVTRFKEDHHRTFVKLEKPANAFYMDHKKNEKMINEDDYRQILDKDQYFQLKEDALQGHTKYFDSVIRGNTSRLDLITETLNALEEEEYGDSKKRLRKQELLAEQMVTAAENNLEDWLNKWRNVRNPATFSPIDHRWRFIRYLGEHRGTVKKIYMLLDNIGPESYESISLGLFLLAFLNNGVQNEAEKVHLCFVAVPAPHLQTMVTVPDVKYMLSGFFSEEKPREYEPYIDTPETHESFFKTFKATAPKNLDSFICLTIGSKPLKCMTYLMDETAECTLGNVEDLFVRLPVFSILTRKNDHYDDLLRKQWHISAMHLQHSSAPVGGYYFLFSGPVENLSLAGKSIEPFDTAPYIRGAVSVDDAFHDEFRILPPQEAERAPYTGTWNLIAVERFYQRLFQQETDTPGNRQTFLISLISTLQAADRGDSGSIEAEAMAYFKIRSPFEDGPEHRFARDLLTFLVEQRICDQKALEEFITPFFRDIALAFKEGEKIILASREGDARQKQLEQMKPGKTYEARESGDKREAILYQTGSIEACLMTAAISRAYHKCVLEKNNRECESVIGFKTCFTQTTLEKHGNKYIPRQQLIRRPIDTTDARRMMEELSRRPFKSISAMAQYGIVDGMMKPVLNYSIAYTRLNSLNNFLTPEDIKCFKDALDEPDPDILKESAGSKTDKSQIDKFNTYKELMALPTFPQVRYRDVMELYIKLYEDELPLRTGGIMVQKKIFDSLLEKCGIGFAPEENENRGIIGDKMTILGIPPKNGTWDEEKLLFQAVIDNLAARRFYNVHCFIENLFSYYKTKAEYGRAGNGDKNRNFQKKMEYIETFFEIISKYNPDANWNTDFIDSDLWIDYHLEVDFLMGKLARASGAKHPYIEKRNILFFGEFEEQNDGEFEITDSFDKGLLANKLDNMPFKNLDRELRSLKRSMKKGSLNHRHKDDFDRYIKNDSDAHKIAVLVGNIGHELEYMLKEAREWLFRDNALKEIRENPPTITFICHPLPFLLWDTIKEDILQYLKEFDFKACKPYLKVETLQYKADEPEPGTADKEGQNKKNSFNYDRYHTVLMKTLADFDTVVVHGGFWYRMFWYKELPPSRLRNEPPLPSANILIRKALKNPEDPLWELRQREGTDEKADYMVHFYRSAASVSADDGDSRDSWRDDGQSSLQKSSDDHRVEAYYRQSIRENFQDRMVARKCTDFVCTACKLKECIISDVHSYAEPIAKRLLSHRGDKERRVLPVVLLKMLEYCKTRTLIVMENALAAAQYDASAASQGKPRLTDKDEWADNPLDIEPSWLSPGDIHNKIREILGPDSQITGLDIRLRTVNTPLPMDDIKMGTQIWFYQVQLLLLDLLTTPPKTEPGSLYILTTAADLVKNEVEKNPAIGNYRYRFITTCFIQADGLREKTPRITYYHGVRVFTGEGQIIGNPVGSFVYEYLVKHVGIYFKNKHERLNNSLKLANNLRTAELSRAVFKELQPVHIPEYRYRYNYGDSEKIVDKTKFIPLVTETVAETFDRFKIMQRSYRLWEANKKLKSIIKNDQENENKMALDYKDYENSDYEWHSGDDDDWNLNLVNLASQTAQYVTFDRFAADYLKWEDLAPPLLPEERITKNRHHFITARSSDYLNRDVNKNVKMPLFERGFQVLEHYLSTHISTQLLLNLITPKEDRTPIFEECGRAIKEMVFENQSSDVLGFSNIRKQEIVDIADNRREFLDYLKQVSEYNPGIKVAVFLNNAGPETMFALWSAYLLLNAGISVTLLAPTFPIIEKDVTIYDVVNLLPYFDGILAKRFGQSSGGRGKGISCFLRKSFRQQECILEIKAFNSSFRDQETVRRDMVREAKNYYSVILLGELWYGYYVGLGNLIEEPVSCVLDGENSMNTDAVDEICNEYEINDPVREKLKTAVKEIQDRTRHQLDSTHVFAAFSHSNPRQPLDILPSKGAGRFAHEVYDTGGCVFQLFPASDYRGDGYNGWRKTLRVFKIEVGDGPKVIGSDKMKREFPPRAAKACRFYFDLEDFSYDVRVDTLDCYRYQSPNKRIRMSVRDFGKEFFLFVEFTVNFGNLKRSGDSTDNRGARSKFFVRKEEWPLIATKIPGLIARHLRDVLGPGSEVIDLSRHKHTPVPPPEHLVTLHLSFPFRLITVPAPKELQKQKQLIHLQLIPTENDNTDQDSGEKIDDKEQSSINRWVETGIYLLQIAKHSRKDEKENDFIRMYVPAFFKADTGTLEAYVPNVSLMRNTLEILRIIRVDLDNDDNILTILEEVDESLLYYQKGINNGPGPVNGILPVLPAPIDVDTPIAERMTVRKLVEKRHTRGENRETTKHFISYSEMVRIGNIFEKNTDPGWWEDYEYMTGLPRVNVHSDEKVLIQLTAPHDTPQEEDPFKDKDGRFSVQRTQRLFNASADLAVLNGAVGVDLNFGSPAVARQGGGAEFSDNAVQRENGVHIAEGLRKHLEKYVDTRENRLKPLLTAKIRLCPREDDSKKPDFGKTSDFIKKLFKHVDWVALHMRTKSMYYSGRCERFFSDDGGFIETFRKIDKQNKKLYYNGDLFNREAVEKFTGFNGFRDVFDGIMIARGMQGNPFIIVDALDFYRNDTYIALKPKHISDALTLHLQYKEENVGYSFLAEKFKASLNKYIRLITETLDDSQRLQLNKELIGIGLIDDDTLKKQLKKELDKIVKPKYYITDRCQKCGICIINAPCSSIDEKKGVFVIKKEKCVGCGQCYHLCPHNAINIVS
ncbi:MAG: hypothetical protein GY757_49715 [bacterium]|nr:hypothetical protein [bacterium]